MTFSIWFMLVIVAFSIVLSTRAQWISADVARWAIKEFRDHESRKGEYRRSRSSNEIKRPSKPFITGDAFRDLCYPHICETAANCKSFDPVSVQDGQCVFIKSDHFDYFVKNKAVRIPKRYVLVSHNGDISAPDGQNDTVKPDMPVFVTSDILKSEYEKGRLLAHHGQNLWWVNWKKMPRPSYLHCLPIGFENRQYNIGKRVSIYADALQSLIIEQSSRTRSSSDDHDKNTTSSSPSDYSSSSSSSSKPLLLVAFGPTSQDRQRLLDKLTRMRSSGSGSSTNSKDKDFLSEITIIGAEQKLSHEQWLKEIVRHKFVLAPFGHGLDTHRVSEILTLGGIPVMRRSSISSCYDDSDNVIGAQASSTTSGSSNSDSSSTGGTFLPQRPLTATANDNSSRSSSAAVLNAGGGAASSGGVSRSSRRGSLPVVILDSWDELTKERLLEEWERIHKIPAAQWDWRRLFVDHWIERIQITTATTAAIGNSDVLSSPLELSSPIKASSGSSKHEQEPAERPPHPQQSQRPSHLQQQATQRKSVAVAVRQRDQQQQGGLPTKAAAINSGRNINPSINNNDLKRQGKPKAGTF